MKYNIQRQTEYSRGELLLRTLFGMFYIMIPHGFCLYFLSIASGVVTLISFWTILIMGEIPRSLFDFQVNLVKWSARVGARLNNLLDGYPAFGLSANDPAIQIEVPYIGQRNRVSVLLRALFGFIYVLIPHGICLIGLAIAASFVRLIAFWIVLITGQYPQGMFDFMVGVQRWGFRVNTFMSYLHDTYPPFSMAPDPSDNIGGDSKPFS
jgi:hypothetical protein